MNPIKLFSDDKKKNRDKNLLKESVYSALEEINQKLDYFFSGTFECSEMFKMEPFAFSSYLRILNGSTNLGWITQSMKETATTITPEEKKTFDFLIENFNLDFNPNKSGIFSYPFSYSDILFISDQKDPNGKPYYLSYNKTNGEFFFHVENDYVYYSCSLNNRIPSYKNIKTINSCFQSLNTSQEKHWIHNNTYLLEYISLVSLKKESNMINKFNIKDKNCKEFLESIVDLNGIIRKINDSEYQTLNDLYSVSYDAIFIPPFKINLLSEKIDLKIKIDNN